MNRISQDNNHLLCRLGYMVGAYIHSQDTWKFGCPKAMKLFVDIVEAMGLFPNDDCIGMTVFVTDERKIEVMVKRKLKIHVNPLTGPESDSDRRQALNRRG